MIPRRTSFAQGSSMIHPRGSAIIVVIIVTYHMIVPIRTREREVQIQEE
uniref:Uncharacterized protein n=1 Tax=Arundo donax TaxID=35708 RepID=A0A0A8Z6T3_ARUDO